MSADKEKNNNIIIVENGLNTCYISSLLMALFYTPSNIYYKLLESDPINTNYTYLQELIKINFVEPIRKNYSITSDIINEIRNFLFINGLQTDDFNEIIKQQNIGKLYLYFIEHLNCQQTDTTTNDIFYIDTKLPFVTINLSTENNLEVGINKLLFTWMTENNVDTSVNKDTFNIFKDIVTKRISNIPFIFPIYIDRYKNDKRNNTIIDIKYNIQPLKGMGDFDKAQWSIHAIICQTGKNIKNIKNGHYYTVLFHNEKWYIFDDQSVPSLVKIDIKSDIFKNKIGSEVVFIIYKYYDE
jgi:ubiquitin C-terminal hydrolase